MVKGLTNSADGEDVSSTASSTAPAKTATTAAGTTTTGSSSFKPLSTTGLSVARVVIPANGSGDHMLESTMPVGISVYGYGQYTSYWYPGGLDLHPITVE